jgi:hypothetical protein
MSALGQKQTLHRSNATSALPPKADIASSVFMSTRRSSMQAAVDPRFGRRAGDSSAMRKIVVKRARYQPARLGHFQTRTKRAKRSARLLTGAKEKPKRAERAFRVFPNARPLRKTRRFPLRRQIPVNIGVGVTAASLGRKLGGRGGYFRFQDPTFAARRRRPKMN